MLALAVSGYLFAAIALTGEGQCPAPDAVQSRLDAVLGRSAGGDYVAQLVQTDGGVRISLRLADAAAPLGTRELKGRDCGALEKATSVVLGTWLAELERKSRLTALAAAPAPRRPLVPAGMQASDGAFPGRSPDLRLLLQVGLLLVGQQRGSPMVGGGGVMVARLGLSLWELQAGVEHELLRSEALARGQVEWTRTGLGVGVSRSVWQGAWGLDLGLRAMRARVDSRGRNFTRNLTGRDAQTALAPHLRLEWKAAEAWSLLFEPTARVWLSPLSFRTEGSASALQLPQTELAATAGIAFHIF